MMCFAHFDCAWRPHSLPSLPLCGKYKVSIIFPLLCYDAWWLLLIGLSWLPYMLGSCACGSNVFPGPFPSSSTVDEFKLIIIIRLVSIIFIYTVM